MGFFDSISRAIGTDGSGGGLLVDIGKPLGFADSSSGLFNNPGVKEAAAVAAIAYGIPSGIEYFGLGSAGAAAGAAGAGEGLLALEAVAPLGSSAVASVTAGGAATAGGLTFGGLANGALSALNTGAQIVGGVNAIKSLSGGGAATARPNSVLQPVYVGGGGTADPLVYRQDAASAGGQNAGASPVVITAPSTAAKDSTLTVLASGLTIAAIIYGFMKKG